MVKPGLQGQEPQVSSVSFCWAEKTDSDYHLSLRSLRRRSINDCVEGKVSISYTLVILKPTASGETHHGYTAHFSICDGKLHRALAAVGHGIVRLPLAIVLHGPVNLLQMVGIIRYKNFKKNKK